MVGDVGWVVADDCGDGPSEQLHLIAVFGEQGVVGDEFNAVCVCVMDGFPSHWHGWLHSGAHDL